MTTLSRADALTILQSVMPQLRALGVERAALFGSVSRDEARPDSDVDVLVRFRAPATFDRYMDARFLLEDAFGRRVDLVSESGLRAELRARVEQDLVDAA